MYADSRVDSLPVRVLLPIVRRPGPVVVELTFWFIWVFFFFSYRTIRFFPRTRFPLETRDIEQKASVTHRPRAKKKTH